MSSRSLVAFPFAALLVALLVACAPAATAVPTTLAPEPTVTPEPFTLTVFAAASLTDAFNDIKNGFEAVNPSITVAYNFAGSNALAQQLGEGAPADVFASADVKQMDAAVGSGRILADTPAIFARNRLVVIVPRDNPGQVETLQDLAEPGLKFVLAANDVPVGQYAFDFLNRAASNASFGATFRDDALANVVSYEDNVRSVLTKVALGEGDAGIVYSSDVNGSSAQDVSTLEIPDELNTIAHYPIGTLRDTAYPAAAQAFVDYVLSPAGQAILNRYGFLSAP